MSIPPEFIYARMKGREAKEEHRAPASTNTGNPPKATASTTKKSSASVYSADTAYSYDKDDLAKPTSENGSLGSKIKKVLK